MYRSFELAHINSSRAIVMLTKGDQDQGLTVETVAAIEQAERTSEELTPRRMEMNRFAIVVLVFLAWPALAQQEASTIQSRIQDGDNDTSVDTVGNIVTLESLGINSVIVDCSSGSCLVTIKAAAAQVASSRVFGIDDEDEFEIFSCHAQDKVGERTSCWPTYDDGTADAFKNRGCMGWGCEVTGGDGFCIGRDCASAGSAFSAGRNAVAGFESVALLGKAGQQTIAIGDAALVYVADISTQMGSAAVCLNIDMRCSSDDCIQFAYGGDGFDTQDGQCGVLGFKFDREQANPLADDCPVDGLFQLGGKLNRIPWRFMALGRGAVHDTGDGPEPFEIFNTDIGAGTDVDASLGALRLRGSAGRGTGSGGPVELLHCPAGGTGSTLNTCVVAVTVDGDTGVMLPKEATADPCGGGVRGFFYNRTDEIPCYCNGTDDLKVSDDTACF